MDAIDDLMHEVYLEGAGYWQVSAEGTRPMAFDGLIDFQKSILGYLKAVQKELRPKSRIEWQVIAMGVSRDGPRYKTWFRIRADRDVEMVDDFLNILEVAWLEAAKFRRQTTAQVVGEAGMGVIRAVSETPR